MLYPVNEIFYSIQGEAHHAGKPAVFIRFSGCNLHCEWCDTDHSKKSMMTQNEIADIALGLIPDQHSWNYPRSNLIVLTGGEPSILGFERLGLLIQTLKSKGKEVDIGGRVHAKVPFMVAMETNGTINIDSLPIDWVTISPKFDHPPLPSMLKKADEIKVVYDTKIKPELYEHAVPRGRLYIQPCSEDFAPAVEFVKNNPKWKLSVQLHKIIKER